MRGLLDTHALLWWHGSGGLSARAREAISDPLNLMLVSTVNIWEISIKIQRGRLRTSLAAVIAATRERGFEELPVSFEHGAAAGSLPPHHRDPFDRMLIAQAQLEGLTIVTRDPVFARYDVATLEA